MNSPRFSLRFVESALVDTVDGLSTELGKILPSRGDDLQDSVDGALFDSDEVLDALSDEDATEYERLALSAIREQLALRLLRENRNASENLAEFLNDWTTGKLSKKGRR